LEASSDVFHDATFGYAAASDEVATRAIQAESSIIGFGPDNWDGFPQTRYHVLAGLAACGWRLTYTNGPHFVWHARAPRWIHARWRTACGVSDGVVLNWPGRVLLRWPRFVTWDRFVQKRYIANLTRQAGWHKAHHRIAYFFTPVFATYLDRLGDCMVVYHADDSFSKMPGWTKELQAAERSLVDRADLLIASSPGVRRNLPGNGFSRARILENGADAALFANGAAAGVPPDLASIPRPRIGYFGTVNPKVDLGLVDAIAKIKPEWHWIFIGPCIESAIEEDPVSRDAWRRLRTRSNVHFLGSRPYRDLPAYQANMDVNTLCYRTDPGGWWTDVSPLKLYEYLAVGRPVVAVPLEVLEPMRHVLALAQGSDEWLLALDQAINKGGAGTSAERREVAFAHGWDAVTAVLHSRLMTLLTGSK
jgi:glycosyltransferase involved in cell wall biosynthesis